MATKQVAGRLTKGVRTFFLPHQPQIVSQWAHTINWIPAIDLRSAIWTLWWDRSLRNSFRANNWDQEWLGQLVCRSLIPPEIRQWWVEVSRLQSRLSVYNTKHAENHYILKHVIKKWKCEKKSGPNIKIWAERIPFSPCSNPCIGEMPLHTLRLSQQLSAVVWGALLSLQVGLQWAPSAWEGQGSHTKVRNRRAHFYFCFKGVVPLKYLSHCFFPKMILQKEKGLGGLFWNNALASFRTVQNGYGGVCSYVNA